jgi:type IV secretion system protein VirB4
MSAVIDLPTGKEVPASDLIPYSSHVTDSIIKTHSGDYIAVIRLEGIAHESADNGDLNAWHNQLNGLLRNIASPNVALWSHIVRRQTDDYPAGGFSNKFCADFNNAYKQRMENKDLRSNALYLTLVLRPMPSKTMSFLSKLLVKQDAANLRAEQLEDIDKLNDLVNTALSSLDRYVPELLGCYDYKGNRFSESLEFLAYLINGEWQRIPLPRNEISDMLVTSRSFFGKGGLMSLKMPTKTTYNSFLAIQEHPSQTSTGMLNELLAIPFDFVLSQSFAFVAKQASLADIKVRLGRMVNAGDVAISQVDDLDQAMDDLVSNRWVMGVHSLTLAISSTTPKLLNDGISLAGTALSDAGIKWCKEDLGAAGAYFAQLPANFEYRVRAEKINSLNFAGFCPLHNYPTGRINHNQWGDAVTMFETQAGGAYYFNFHKGEVGAEKALAKIDKNHKELANTIVIGQSGAGKTVLLGMLLAQLQKFHTDSENLTCVVFDKDLGTSIAVQAMGGKYFPLKNGVASGFNPFQLEPTPNNITFLIKLIKRLVKHESYTITPTQEQDISKAVAGVMRADKEHRRLSSVIQFLNRTEDNGIYARLKKWCSGGELGWLFDNATDTLNIDNSPIIGFDVTEFLDNDDTSTPTIMYLFHRIESLFDGRRMPIIMDEFWKLLKDEEFQDLAQNKLVTIRKQNGFLILATQSPQQVLKNKIAYAIVEQTATKIFLPNPSADYDDYVNGFKLTEKEYWLIKNLGEKSRCFLVKQGDNSVVVKLDLKGFDDELAVLSGNTATAMLAERVIEQYGNNPNVWLPEFHKQRKGECTV